MCCAVLCLVAQSCPTSCDPMDCTHQAPLSMGILQARILEWVAIPSSRGSSQPRDQSRFSCIASRFLLAELPGKPKNITWWWWFSCSVVSDSCDPMDYSPPGSSVQGILQARILDWVAISFSRGSSPPRN